MRCFILLLAALVLLTQDVMSLGASELPETVDIDLANVRQGPIRQADLPPDLLKRATALEPVFADVYPTTHEKWIENFRRDVYPEREIAIWEQIAAAYTQFFESRNAPIANRQEAFGLLLYRSGATTEDTLKKTKLKYLTRDEATRLLKLYQAAPAPIIVEKR